MSATEWDDKPMPCCGFLTRGASTRDGKEDPHTGDICICLNCGTWGRFADDTGTVRIMTKAEITDLKPALVVEMTHATMAIKLRGLLPRDQW